MYLQGTIGQFRQFGHSKPTACHGGSIFEIDPPLLLSLHRTLNKESKETVTVISGESDEDGGCWTTGGAKKRKRHGE